MRIYRLLADMLDYPSPRLLGQISECLTLLPPEFAASMRDFYSFAEQAGDAQLEELYTGTFDMRRECSLYIGYQIFGDDHRRGFFMAKLREEYRAHGFSDGGELPDHLPVVLRYIAAHNTDEVIAELVTECVLPAISKALLILEAERHPYTPLLQAVSVVLTSDATLCCNSPETTI
jgi:nitrate reductase molybdenum cofactor assembly chaperone NarJ/NarW